METNIEITFLYLKLQEKKNMTVLDRSLFQIFLRKIWLMNIAPYVSESRKLSVPSRTFGRTYFVT